MAAYCSAILIGISAFPVLAVVFTGPILAETRIRYGAWNLVRIGLNYVVLLYMLCLMAVVFLPLPTAEQAAALSGYRIQSIPFQFVLDIIRESPLRLNNPATYLPALYNRAVLQVILNILMTVPFGMFLRYYHQRSVKQILILTILLSLFIELTQLTGIYGMYSGSYRLCDVDDVIANCLGGYVGYRLMRQMEGYLPSIEAFDLTYVHGRRASHAR